MKALFPLLLFSLFFLILFFPQFQSIDIIGPQYLFLSFVNLLLLFFHNNFKYFYKSSVFYLLIFLLLQIFLSLLYTNNLNISIVDSSRYLILLLTIINFSNLFKSGKISFYNISVVLTICLIIETFWALRPVFIFLYVNDFSNYVNFSSIYDVGTYIGFAGNKNITAASVAIKFPFFLYFLNSTKSISRKLSYFFVPFFFMLIFLLRARAVYVSLGLILLLFTLYFLYNKKFKFLIIPFFALVSFLFVNYITKTNSNSLVNDVASINISADSSNNRFLLWDNAISYIKEHPIIGAGYGNWKIESLPYWSTHLNAYTVPYHAHNDFLEISTELGIIGGLTYLSLFIIMFWKLFVLFRSSSPTNQLFVLTLFCSLSIYFIDASLNFPFERSRMQIMLATIISIFISRFKFL